jgi:hypothetical protein
LKSVPGDAFSEIDAGSSEFNDCKLAAKLALGDWPGAVLGPPSARRDTINFDIPATKSCFETLPVPLGSSHLELKFSTL